MMGCYITPVQAAEVAGVDHSTLVRWCQRVGIPLAVKVGGRWRVDPSALRRYLNGDPLTGGNHGRDQDRQRGGAIAV
jgi:excisionase family DNA binding protein